MLSDVLSDQSEIQRDFSFAHGYLGRGKKWTAPVPWGRSSLGIELGGCFEWTVLEFDRLYTSPSWYQGGTDFASASGYAEADFYQQILRDYLSAFGKARISYGYAPPNDLFGSAVLAQSIGFGGGIEWRTIPGWNLTGRLSYEYLNGHLFDGNFQTDIHSGALSFSF